MTRLVTQYFHRKSVALHDMNLKHLFDLNFGKDWRLFLNLFYSLEYGKHTVVYRNPTSVERTKFKNPNHAGVIRQGFYAGCKGIMKLYYETQDMELVEKEINADKFRFKWTFKKGEERQIIISDELYNKLYNKEETSEQE